MIFDNELRHLGVLIAKKGRQEAFDEIKKLLKNEELADNTASNCNDSEHDDRWCSTCTARYAGIDDYRNELLRLIEEKTE